MTLHLVSCGVFMEDAREEGVSFTTTEYEMVAGRPPPPPGPRDKHSQCSAHRVVLSCAAPRSEASGGVSRRRRTPHTTQAIPSSDRCTVGRTRWHASTSTYTTCVVCA